MAAVHALAADHLRALDHSKTKAEIECLYETELGLLTYIERAMVHAAREPARPIYDDHPSSVSNSGAAPAAACACVSRPLDSGSDTENEGAAAAGGIEWFTSEEDESSDEGGAMLCAACNKWSDTQRMRGTICLRCWRRHSGYDGETTQGEENSAIETANDFVSD